MLRIDDICTFEESRPNTARIAEKHQTQNDKPMHLKKRTFFKPLSVKFSASGHSPTPTTRPSPIHHRAPNPAPPKKGLKISSSSELSPSSTPVIFILTSPFSWADAPT